MHTDSAGEATLQVRDGTSVITPGLARWQLLKAAAGTVTG